MGDKRARWRRLDLREDRLPTEGLSRRIQGVYDVVGADKEHY